MIRLNLLQKYLLREFFSSFAMVLLAACSLFVVFDFFERVDNFIEEGSTVGQVVSYILLQLPLIIQLMTPVAILIGTLIAVGRLSQLSEITAMRACGISVVYLAMPIIAFSFIAALLMGISGETLVPWSSTRSQEIYQLDIRKKAEKGQYDRAQFWFRSENQFFNVGLYDSRENALKGLSLLEIRPDEFEVQRRIDAAEARWERPEVGWLMNTVVETTIDKNAQIIQSNLQQLPLVIAETPSDFYDMKRKPETMSYQRLSKLTEKLRREGVPTIRHQVDLAAKIAFPFVCVVAALVAFPFAIVSSRSGGMSISFVIGVSIGFAYYFVHALATSLGKAELIPITASAWTANILLASLGGFLLAGADD